MEDIVVIKIVFGIMLSLGGLVLLFLAFRLFYRYLVQEKRCTAKTRGVVCRYTLASRGGQNSGVHLPVVSYTVNGKAYRVTGPEYRGYRTVTKTSPACANTMECREENQVLTIRRTANAMVRIDRNPMAAWYPLRSEIDVYYDPRNPKLAYVLRYCNQKWAFWLTFFSGVFVLILDLGILLI